MLPTSPFGKPLELAYRHAAASVIDSRQHSVWHPRRLLEVVLKIGSEHSRGLADLDCHFHLF